jgi:uncharacterized protein (TIGR00369 family)
MRGAAEHSSWRMSDTLPPFNAKDASKFFTKHGHSGWLGLKFCDAGENWVELKLPWREDLLGEKDREVLASGPIISLLDMTSGMAIWNTSRTFKPTATLDLRVDYQRPAKERSAVIARAECYKMTRSAAFVRGIAHDGDPDNPVATMAGVFMVFAKRPKSGKNANG